MWITSTIGSRFVEQGGIDITTWGRPLILTSLTTSMTVNALVTSLIVFRIFKVFREIKAATADEKSLDVTGGRKIRSVMFIIIESGMALFIIQLARLATVISVGDLSTVAEVAAFDFIAGIHEMLTVIILSLLFYILLITWTWLGYNTYHHRGTGINGIVFLRRDIFGRNCQ
jgi:hypothetical protein